MSGRTEIERFLDGFLAEGPETVADQALTRALDAVDRTSQRRGPFASWRLPAMNAYTRLAAAAVVAVVVAGGALYLFGQRGGVGTPRPTAVPTPVVTPSPPAASAVPAPTIPLDVTTWTPFTTSLYGYTIAYPTGWQRSPATEIWAGQSSYDMWASTANAPWADKTYFGPAGITMTGLATVIPAGTSEEAWIDAYLAPPVGETPTCIELAKDMTAIVIDGKPARLAVRCGNQVAFVSDGNRMFVFAESNANELPLLNAYLSTIRLPAPTASPS
jgi:hypothetical protein